MKKILKSTLILATFVVLAACGGGGGGSDEVSVTCTSYEYGNTVSATCRQTGGSREGRDTPSTGGYQSPDTPADAGPVGSHTPAPAPTPNTNLNRNDSTPPPQTSTPSSAPVPPKSVYDQGFVAHLASAPEDGEYVCDGETIYVHGAGIQNVEMVDANDPSIILRRFTIQSNGVARLDLNTKFMQHNDVINARILAWDVPQGENGTMIEVMPARTWYVDTIGGFCPATQGN